MMPKTSMKAMNNSVTATNSSPKPADMLSAMHTIGDFLEKLRSELNQFYFLESQLMGLMTSTSFQTSIHDFSLFPLHRSIRSQLSNI